VTQTPLPAPMKREQWLYWGAWFVAFLSILLALYLGWRTRINPSIEVPPVLAAVQPTSQLEIAAQKHPIQPPELHQTDQIHSISRSINLRTIIPTRPRQEPITYTVSQGDSVFAIARSFGISPETILWANYELLNDNPDMLTPGMELKIPPVNGVLYEWQEGDTLEGVAAKFDAKVEDILNFPGNKLDLTNPVVAPGTFVMIPGGHREFRQWLIPTIPRGAAGVSQGLYGSGTCTGDYEGGALGSGSFIWPSDSHYLSGNDYWSGHLAIDIGAGEGAAIYAADSGVVVFSGAALGGYGNMIMIDHGNGYQTLYAHLSRVVAGCGKSVTKGQLIGYAGSTGHSTGPHLHFEVRYLGGFVNPWYVLPAP
jgi:murein DD-endopeptidase MepM/ murein hydrolase activator NlpD